MKNSPTFLRNCFIIGLNNDTVSAAKVIYCPLKWVHDNERWVTEYSEGDGGKLF
jgi:hypothetical protein